MLGAVIGVVVAMIVVQVLLRLQVRRNTAAAEAGTSFRTAAKLRLVDQRGLARRWREGFVVRDGDGVRFRSRAPRPGPVVDLNGATIAGTRPARGIERWWFAGPTVLVVETSAGRVEIGGGSDEHVNLARRALRGAP